MSMSSNRRNSRLPSIVNKDQLIKKQQMKSLTFAESKIINDRRLSALLYGAISVSLFSFVHFTKEAAY